MCLYWKKLHNCGHQSDRPYIEMCRSGRSSCTVCPSISLSDTTEMRPSHFPCWTCIRIIGHQGKLARETAETAEADFFQTDGKGKLSAEAGSREDRIRREAREKAEREREEESRRKEVQEHDAVKAKKDGGLWIETSGNNKRGRGRRGPNSPATAGPSQPPKTILARRKDSAPAGAGPKSPASLSPSRANAYKGSSNSTKLSPSPRGMSTSPPSSPPSSSTTSPPTPPDNSPPSTAKTSPIQTNAWTTSSWIKEPTLLSIADEEPAKANTPFSGTSNMSVSVKHNPGKAISPTNSESPGIQPSGTAQRSSSWAMPWAQQTAGSTSATIATPSTGINDSLSLGASVSPIVSTPITVPATAPILTPTTPAKYHASPSKHSPTKPSPLKHSIKASDDGVAAKEKSSGPLRRAGTWGFGRGTHGQQKKENLGSAGGGGGAGSRN